MPFAITIQDIDRRAVVLEGRRMDVVGSDFLVTEPTYSWFCIGRRCEGLDVRSCRIVRFPG